MKLRIMFVIEQNEASNDQIAACASFADSMGLAMSIVPEAERKKERVQWNHASTVQMDGKVQKLVEEVLGSFKDGGVAPRKEFVDALAVKLRKKPREVGKLVAKWVREGVLEEVA